MEKELRAIGKDMDNTKEIISWWTVDEYVAILRECHRKLLAMKPKKSCQNCRHFTLLKCSLADKMPPEQVLQKGCEKFQDSLGDLLG